MDAKNFAKEVESAARADLRNGVPVGQIGPKLKELSKLDAIRRITDEKQISDCKKYDIQLGFCQEIISFNASCCF